VVLNPGSVGRIRLPGTLCAALGSLSIKRLIFCVTDSVLLWNKTCKLNCVKKCYESLQHNRRSGFDSLQRKCWTTNVNCEKGRWQHTPLLESNTTVNGRDLTLPTRTQTSEQEYNDLAASNGRQHRVHSTLPKAFHKEPGRMLLEVDKVCEDVFSILPIFFKILLESEMWSVLLWPGRKPHWVSFRFDSIISRTPFSWHLAT